MSVLVYSMEQGRTEKTIVRQCMLARNPIPEAIRNAPELLPGLGLYYDAFLELSPSRGRTALGEELAINWKDLHDYCSVYGIEGDQKEDFLVILRYLDQEFLNYKREKVGGS